MNRPPWKERRRRIDLALIFCAGLIVWLLWRNTGSAVDQAAITTAFGVCVILLSVYTGAATIDDNNVMKHMGPAAYDDRAPGP
ncbi:hypothetical protein HPDFL43_05915 [Hoeflea phototrophica DFL-43]|jgi:uncharacterized membrane protein YobD (UPF0266 family)|uniref:Uncharacterized protein n=1 Tax=Hoeflea phototrophica (strain DSM 17068 / NCIMB 14078 / DFL-43) TaxID=411684 RepID=A9D4U9_HOEPD|nr:hypothetical protein [Hoeflea phototrophica]EDQ33966.1 hypothetical protein HPDFL43_05915 [Hoeflea phototrophica DFL-43]